MDEKDKNSVETERVGEITDATKSKIYTGDYIFKHKYNNGKHAISVELLEHPVTGHKLIKKRYKTIHGDIFFNEVKYLEKLKDCDFVPKIFKLRPEKLTIYMTYCGEPIKMEKLKKYTEQIAKYQTILESRNIYHNDIKSGNICLLDDKVYLIDFGWASHKRVKAGYSSKNSVTSQ